MVLPRLLLPVLLVASPLRIAGRCEPYCQTPCAELNGDWRAECASCSRDMACNTVGGDGSTPWYDSQLLEPWPPHEPIVRLKSSQEGEQVGSEPLLRDLITQALFPSFISTARVHDSEWLDELEQIARADARRMAADEGGFSNDAFFQWQMERNQWQILVVN